MNVLQRGAVAFGFALVGLGLASCSGGGPNVPAIYPTATASGATPTPSSSASAAATPTASSSAGATATPTAGATATPSSGATVAPTASASAGATATPTSAATATPTAGATATPTSAATATPTPMPTSTVAANCPPPSPFPSPSSTTIPFSAMTGTINLPTYQDITGTSDIPPITGGLPASVTIKLGRTNFDNTPNPGMGTPVLYSSLILQGSNSSGQVTFNTNMIPVHLTSPCSVLAGHTYNVYGYVGATQIEAKTNLTPSGDTVTTTLDIPGIYGDSFPYNTLVDIVATQN